MMSGAPALTCVKKAFSGGEGQTVCYAPTMRKTFEPSRKLASKTAHRPPVHSVTAACLGGEAPPLATLPLQRTRSRKLLVYAPSAQISLSRGSSLCRSSVNSHRPEWGGRRREVGAGH